MSDFFKSAINYFNTGPNGEGQDEFVNSIVEVGALKLKITRKLAEGKRNFISFEFVIIL